MTRAPRLQGLLGAAAAAAAFAAPSAAATAPAPSAAWVLASPISLAGVDSAPRAIAAPDGGALVAWGVYGSRGLRKTELVAVGPDGQLGARHAIDGRWRVPGTLDERGNGLVASVARGRVAWAEVSRDGRLGRARAIAGSAPIEPPSAAANSRGDGLLTWCERVGRARRLMAATRRAGGTFGRPIALPAPATCSDLVATAIGPAGDIAVVLSGKHATRTKRTSVVTGRIGGRTLRRAVTLGKASATVEASAAFDGTGKLYVAWRSQKQQDDAMTPWQTRVASLGRAASRPSGVRLLAHGISTGSDGAPQMAGSPASGAVVGFTTTGADSRAEAYVALTRADGTFGSPALLGTRAAFGNASFLPNGTAVLTWSEAGGLRYAPAARDGLGVPEETGLPAESHALGVDADGHVVVTVVSDPDAGPQATILRSVRR